MSWPFRNSRAVTALSPEVESLLRSGGTDRTVSGACPAPGVPPLPGTFRAQLLAAYERRGAAPASPLRLLVREVRWPAAAISAAAAACVVVFAGAPSGGFVAPGRSSLSGGLASVTAPSSERNLARGTPPSRSTSSARAGERELAFAGGEWEHVHPLPSSVASVRVVDDQNLALIGVGWTPDLDGP